MIAARDKRWGALTLALIQQSKAKDDLMKMTAYDAEFSSVAAGISEEAPEALKQMIYGG